MVDGRPPPRRRLLLVSAALGDDQDDEALVGPGGVLERLGDRGVEVVFGHPLRVTLLPERLDGALDALSDYRFVALTSRRAAQVLGQALRRRGLDAGALAAVRFACLDGATARELAEVIGRPPDVVQGGGGAALAGALLAAGVGAGPVLFLRAAEARDELPRALEKAGVSVDLASVYETRIDEAEVARLRAWAAATPPAAIACGSPRGALALVDAGLPFASARVGAIGATTAAALAGRGVRVDVVASRPSFAVLCAELGAALAPGGEMK
jgi:uroporphyrinogen-III synthase